MSFFINLSQCAPYNDGSKTYKSLWQYLHCVRASNRPDLVSRISSASNIAVIASLANGAVGNTAWISNNKVVVKNAVEKYYKSNASDLNELIKKTKDGIHVGCRMMDKYVIPNEFDFVGGVIRNIVQVNMENTKVNTATTTSKSNSDVQVIQFKSNEEKTSHTDDGTFERLNKIFWRSQNNRTPEIMARQKQSPTEVVVNMRERARDTVKTQIDNVVSNTNIPVLTDAKKSPELRQPALITSAASKNKSQAPAPTFAVFVSTKSNPPSTYDLIVSTKNANDGALPNSIYIPIDAHMIFNENVMNRFFKSIHTLSKTKNIYIYAVNDVANFIVEGLKVYNVNVSADVTDDMNVNLKNKLRAITTAPIS